MRADLADQASISTHPVVGELSVSLNRLDLPADHGLTIFIYAVEPGSRSEQALTLLGSWAATAEPTAPVPEPTETIEPQSAELS